MNPREVETHVQDLFDGNIGPEALHLLEQELRSNPAARDVYRDYVHLQNGLQQRADGIDLLHVIPMDRVIARRQRRHFRNALLGAAALLALCGIIAGLVIIAQPKPEQLALSATADTLWMVDGSSDGSDGKPGTVRPGSDLSVHSGTVRLAFDSGAEMVIQGPAAVSFPKLENPVLKRGWLWLDTKNSGVTFEVTTPDLRLHNLGTRFGVRVPEKGAAEVHVVDGKVEVLAESSETSPLTLEPEEQGVAITALGETSQVDLARDPFPSLEKLLTAPADYKTTVLGQNPAGFWKLDSDNRSNLPNEVEDGIVGLGGSGVRVDGKGPRPGDGFEGFDPKNRATRFTGSKDKSSISLGTTPVHTGVLFRDDFDGTGPLNGRAVKVAGVKQKWIAAEDYSVFNADGSFVGAGQKADVRRGGSATMRFNPVEGVIYTLDASVSDLTGSSWLAFGFARGQHSRAGKDARFLGGSVSGRAWMLLTGTTRNQPPGAFLGTSGTRGGTADNLPWSHWDDGVTHADVRIVLDTTGGPGGWTATWYAKPAGAKEFQTVRETATLLNEEISSVGFAVSSAGISGTIERISLSAHRKTQEGSQPHATEAPAGMSLREGAVSFWLRRDPKVARRQVLWAAGLSPEDDSVHARLEADGRVGFFMENKRYDVLITSEDGITDDRWHHIAASWSPTRVELYVDGQQVASDTEFRGNQQGKLSELRFGVGPKGSSLSPFVGWMDEISIWKRPLTHPEVTRQFRSAEGGE